MIITRKEILGEGYPLLGPYSLLIALHQKFGINTSEMEIVNLDSTDGLRSYANKNSSQEQEFRETKMAA